MTRRVLALFSIAAVVAAIVTFIQPAGADDQTDAGAEYRFLVLYADGTSLESGQAAVAAAGGTVLTENATIGLAEVASTCGISRGEAELIVALYRKLRI